MKKKALTVFFLITIMFSNAQNDRIDLEHFAERLFQVQDQNISYEDIYESLLVFYSDKLNLNSSTPSELASLYILNPIQINNFFNYRDTYGDLLSINELQVIPEFDLETIRLLQPFVTIIESNPSVKPFLQRLIEEENNYLLLRYSRRLETQVGYTPALPLDTAFILNENQVVTDTITSPPQRYRGSPSQIYGRFRTSRKDDFSIGVTFEKDAGEKVEFTEDQKGFDFYSYHILLEDKFGLDKLILGDYQLQIGQGIVLGAGFAPGKGAETVNAIKRNSLGIRPYTSVLESGFFRGIGITKSLGGFSLISFYSNLKQDATVQTGSDLFANSSTLDEEEFVNSIQGTGFHRTQRELEMRDRLKEETLGAVIEYKPNNRLSVGLTGLNSNFTLPLRKRPNNYNQFEFQGDHNFTGSAYFNYTWQNFNFFGEGAGSKSGGIGAVGGFVASLSPIVDMGFLVRNYDRDFHSFYGSSLAEGSRNINEKGTYWGLRIKPNRKHIFNLYYDRFRFPWLRFQSEAPSLGYEYLFRYTFNPTKLVTMYAQHRQQSRQVSIAQDNLNILTEQIRRTYIFNIDYEPSPNLKLKTRVQSSTQDEGQVFTKGFAIVQDVNFQLWKVRVYSRMGLFETDDFDNAQYVYERDVLYLFSVPALNGSGVRNYVMIRYDLLKKISLWIRYARTTFPSTFGTQNEIGSSLEASTGDTSSSFRMMLRVKF